MADTDPNSGNAGLASMAQQFSGLPIKSLIGSPLSAAAEANANMAYTQYQFMMGVCFNEEAGKDGAKGKLTPIMVSFTITRSIVNQDGEASDPATAEVEFTLPLMTIIPLNALAVETVDVSFEMDVKSSHSLDTSTSTKTKTSAKGGFTAGYSIGPFHAQVHGSVSASSDSKSSSAEHYSSSNHAKYTIGVHAGQLPLPQGVTTIIDTFTKNISPLVIHTAPPTPTPTPTPAPAPKPSGG